MALFWTLQYVRTSHFIIYDNGDSQCILELPRLLAHAKSPRNRFNTVYITLFCVSYHSIKLSSHHQTLSVHQNANVLSLPSGGRKIQHYAKGQYRGLNAPPCGAKGEDNSLTMSDALWIVCPWMSVTSGGFEWQRGCWWEDGTCCNFYSDLCCLYNFFSNSSSSLVVVLVVVVVVKE